MSLKICVKIFPRKSMLSYNLTIHCKIATCHEKSLDDLTIAFLIRHPQRKITTYQIDLIYLGEAEYMFNFAIASTRRRFYRLRLTDHAHAVT